MRIVNESLATKKQEAAHTHQDNARLLGHVSRTQGNFYQAQEEVRGLQPLKDELSFAQRRIEELGRLLIKQDAAVKQFGKLNAQLKTRVDELLKLNPQMTLELVTA